VGELWCPRLDDCTVSVRDSMATGEHCHNGVGAINEHLKIEYVVSNGC